MVSIPCFCAEWSYELIPPRHGLKKAGDGVRRGTVVDSSSSIRDFSSWGNSPVVSFECGPWRWHSHGAQKQREDSRSLTRLHLLKELFNIFLNRAVCIPTCTDTYARMLIAWFSPHLIPPPPLPWDS